MCGKFPRSAFCNGYDFLYISILFTLVDCQESHVLMGTVIHAWWNIVINNPDLKYFVVMWK